MRPLAESDQGQGALDLHGQPGDPVDAPQQVEAEGAAALAKSRDHNVFAHRQAVKELVDLIAFGQAELAHPGYVHAGDVAAVENYMPGGRRQLAGQHLEQCALPGAIGTDNAAQFAGRDRQVEVAVGGQSAK